MKTFTKLAAAAALATAVAGTSATAAPVTTAQANDPYVSTALAGVSGLALIGVITAVVIIGATSGTN